MQLYIGNKNYSSWSMRAWLVMTHFGIAFTERPLRLDWAEGSPFKSTLLALAPTGRVPLLIETMASRSGTRSRSPSTSPRPSRPSRSGRASAASARAHEASARRCTRAFAALRNRCPMNIEASLPEVGARCRDEWRDVAADLRRIDAMWTEALAQSGGPFLFGAFSAVDAFFAPVCSRVRTYALPLGAVASAYVDRVHAVPAMQAWCQSARQENDFIDDDEPYRQRA